jgi:hypothetical protein
MKPNIKKLLKKKSTQNTKIFRLFKQDGFNKIPWSKFKEYQELCSEMLTTRLELIKKDRKAIESFQIVDFKEYGIELLSELKELKVMETELKRIVKKT